MRSCLSVTGWTCLLLLIFGTGSWALCVMLYVPHSAKMLGCTDCPVLGVGDPDAPWDRLEPDTQYVLVGCHNGELREASGHDWFIIGNAKRYKTGDPHAVAVRVGESQRQCGIDRCPVQMWGNECFRMLVSYEPEHGSSAGMQWLSFVAQDSTNDFDD